MCFGNSELGAGCPKDGLGHDVPSTEEVLRRIRGTADGTPTLLQVEAPAGPRRSPLRGSYFFFVPNPQ